MTPIPFHDIRQLHDAILDAHLSQYVAVLLQEVDVRFAPGAISRVLQIGADTEAAILYSHYRETTGDGRIINHPVAPWQIGSVGDSFDFGPVVFLNAAQALNAIDSILDNLGNNPLPLDGGWYALRLRLTIDSNLMRLPEYLYTSEKTDNRKSGERQFDYLRQNVAVVQKEHEAVFRSYLRNIHALLSGNPEKIDFTKENFTIEASVVIPVRNRVSTIADAVHSALNQKADFAFNVIVVDNLSDDGTSDVLAAIHDPRLIVLHPEPDMNLGIGGCWNLALDSEHCGRFAVQLDSDDLYADTDTLAKIVAKFHTDHCAMVVGSYVLSDFDLNTLPPGLIDHREWTDHNGRNNALRVNGFGAPRAYYTPLARDCRFPDVSYGEDYAMCMRISREYYVGRIYEPIYICRRWEGNSDADLNPQTIVDHQTYKDYLRSVEIMARMKLNRMEMHERMKGLDGKWHRFDDDGNILDDGNLEDFGFDSIRGDLLDDDPTDDDDEDDDIFGELPF